MNISSKEKAEAYYIGAKPLVDEEEQELRKDEAQSWINHLEGNGHGLSLRMVILMNAYIDGHLELNELHAELGRPFLH